MYDESDLEWLNICSRLRASGMPLRAIREYVELVRAGAGNELAECYELISGKVTIYEKHVAQGDADRLRNPERAD